MMRLHAARGLAAACLALIAAPAIGWGADGHRIVAALAERQLTPVALAEVRRLLEIEPGSTLGSISTWADETRSPSTAAWHYVNLPRDANCVYEAARDCPGGQCVVGAIERQAEVLASKDPDAAKLKALKYLVHLVADVHQPLHAGYADDKGGNRVQLQAFGRGANLHSLWDSGLIENWLGGVPSLLKEVSSYSSPARDALRPELWAEESCRLVASPGFYPDGHKIGPEYLERMAPVLKERLTATGRRLAALLNGSLTHPSR